MKHVRLIYFSVLILGILISPLNAQSQGIGVNETGSSPHPSSGLDVDFSDKGLLMPRMTTAERDAIVSPANGLMIWNTSTICLDVYVVNTWQSLSCGCSAPPSSPALITGPASVCAGTGSHVYSISAVQGATAYNWSIPAGATITAGFGTTAITLSFGSASGNVSVTARNNCGDSQVTALPVTVNPILAAGVSIAASPSGAVCAGVPVTFTATPSNGGGSPSYQWKLNGNDVGTNSATYINSSLVTGNQVSCVMSSAYACPSGSPATSNTLTMTVNTVSTGTQTFTANGTTQNFVVPACVTAVTVKAWGGGGGGGGGAGQPGGGGAYATSVLSVTPGETLGVIAGGGGQGGQNISGQGNVGGGAGGTGGTAGFGAGGNGSNSGFVPYSAGGAGGGGGSFVLRSSTILLAAGGGGGGGSAEASGAGAGGGGGQNGSSGSCGAVGGTAGSNGISAGAAGIHPGNIDASGPGGGGGGFLGGGGGGAPSCDSLGGAGGGGGSSLGTTVNNGSGTTPGNAGDPDRGSAGNAGAPAGGTGTSGTAGKVIISW